MDYKFIFDSINSKKTELSNIKSDVDAFLASIVSDLSVISSTEISSLYSEVDNLSDRLKTAFSNCITWMENYISDLSELEEGLANFNGNLDAPTEFIGEFEHIFDKVTIPTLQTGGDKKANIDAFTTNEITNSTLLSRVPDNNAEIKVPYMSQGGQESWAGEAFGGGTIASSGCSITSIAMVLSTLKNKYITPSDVKNSIASNNGGNYNAFYVGSVGQSWSIFDAVGKYYNVNCNQIDTSSITTALKNGNPVIVSCRPGKFTSAGLFYCINRN